MTMRVLKKLKRPINRSVAVLGQGNLEFTDLESSTGKEFKDVSLSKDSKQIGIATLEIKVDPPSPVVTDSKMEDKNKRKIIARKGSSSVPSSRDISFRKLFSLPETETLLQDYSCSLFLEFLHHGKLYISRSYLCFYSKVFDIRIVETIPFSEITSIEQKDIFQGNQGISITKATNVFNFGSFLSRDKTHAKLISLWKDSVNYSVPSLSKSEEISPGSFGTLSSASEDLRSSLNLEHTEDDELGSDEPDSADSPLITEKLPLECSNIFEIAYGDEVPFTKRFYDNLGSTDLYVQKWNKDNFRSISYRSPAQNNSVTRVEEVQKFSHVKENTLIVETILYMLDIPYGDHFYTKVVHSYKGTENDCSISITANVHFTKKMLLEAKTRAQTIKLMKEKSEAFVSMLKEEIPKREKSPSIRRDESSIPTYSQVTSAIMSRVPPKLRTFNALQRPLCINGFLCSIMGLAMIFLVILADYARNKAFYDALKATIKKGQTEIVDIGAGTGFLSFLASNLGAKSCTLIEGDVEFSKLSKLIANRNNIQNCRFISTHSTKVRNIPKVDVIISETLGGYALEENIIENINDGRKFLKEGGIIIPGKLEQFIAPVSGNTLHNSLVAPWNILNRDFKLDFTDASNISLANMFQKPVPKQDIYRGEENAVRFDSINFYQNNKSTRRYQCKWTFDEEITIYGLCAWWKAELIPGVFITTSPFAQLTHWEQIYFPFKNPILCKKRQQMAVDIHSNTTYQVGVKVDWKVTMRQGGTQLLSFTNKE